MSGSAEPIPGRCGAGLRKQPGRFCAQRPLPGKTRCKWHGGLSLSGIAHPNWKHGMYSAALPSGLLKHYEAARTNPALIELTEQVALVDAKVYELFDTLAGGDGPGAIKRALQAFQDFKTAQAQRQGAAMVEALGRLEQALVKGDSDATTWNRITGLIYLRKKLVDSEVKRRKAASEVLLKAQVVNLMGFIAASVARHVTDPKQKQAVVDDIRRALSAGGEVPHGT